MKCGDSARPTGKILSVLLPADIQTGEIARKNHHLKYPN